MTRDSQESQEDTARGTKRPEKDLNKNSRMPRTTRRPRLADGARGRKSIKHQTDMGGSVHRTINREPNPADGSRERGSISHTRSVDDINELTEVDRETELDLEVLRLFETENEHSWDFSDQLSSTYCYGRGKTLADITLPRLPKKFQGKGAAGAFNTLDVFFESQFRSRTDHLVGCGRGRLLEIQASSLETEMILGDGGSEQDEVPAVSQENHRSQTKPSSLLLDSRVDYEFYSQSTAPTTYSVKSQDDFPSLSAGSSSVTSTRSRPVSKSKRGRGRLKSQQRNITPTEAFQDAEETTFDDLASAIHSQQSSEIMDVISDSTGPFVRDREGDNLNSGQKASESAEIVSYMNIDKTSCDDSSLNTNMNSHSCDGASESNVYLGKSAPQVDLLGLDDIDDVELSPEKHESGAGKESLGKKTAEFRDQPSREETEDSAEKAELETQKITEVLPRLDSDKNESTAKKDDRLSEETAKSNREASISVFETKESSTPKMRAGLDTESLENKPHEDDKTAEGKGEGSASISETKETKESSKPKKKVPGSWRLDGPLVLQVENVPKSCGGALKDYLAAFGKIIDSEKKSQKGANAWRFMFENPNDCDYAVSCLDGADNLFEGHSCQLVCYRLGQDKDDGTPV